MAREVPAKHRPSRTSGLLCSFTGYFRCNVTTLELVLFNFQLRGLKFAASSSEQQPNLKVGRVGASSKVPGACSRIHVVEFTHLRLGVTDSPSFFS